MSAQADIPRGLLPGIRLFNAGEYFEAHEAWEEHWGSGTREEREATLGLIKAAVALHHLRSGNEHGFLWQAKEAAPRLKQHAGLWPGLDLAALAEELESLMSQARFHGKLPEGWGPPHIPLAE